MKFIIVFSFVVMFSLAEKQPSIFRKCKRKDKICLKEAIEVALFKLKEGYKEWSIPAIDPVFIPKMTIDEGRSVVQLKQHYENGNFYGISETTIVFAEFDMDLKLLTIKFAYPKWTFNATYEVNGRILLLPVFGRGTCSLTFDQGVGRLSFNLEPYEMDGHTYLRGTNGHYIMDVKKATYQFDNLFNGNRLLGFAINRVLNENWREVYSDVRAGYHEALVSIFMNNFVNKIFGKIPIDELFEM